MRLVDLAHQHIAQHLPSGATAIDATVGNGYDTAFLAEMVGRQGKVYGFDIQPMAIEVATMILKTKKCFAQCKLFEMGHQHMIECIPEETHGAVAVVMFNLGYLPHGDKTLITRSPTTLIALDQSLQLLARGGLISILSYRGHAGGSEEFTSVQQWIRSKTSSLKIICEQDSANPESVGPFLWILQKL